MSIHADRAASFGRAAAEYERGRPDYPADAVEWMIPPGAKNALDLGAGTGKLSRLLLGRGLELTAVDPAPEMLAQLEASIAPLDEGRLGVAQDAAQETAGVTTLVGFAESLPVPDCSFDLVTAAQAWHWVDPDRAYPEVSRVLRPGGTLSLVWNVSDYSSDWMRAIGDIIIDREESQGPFVAPVAGSEFEPFEAEVFEWIHRVSRAAFLDHVASRSVFIVAPPEEQERTLDQLTAFLDTHPLLAGRDELLIPYRAYAFRARVRG